MNRRDTYGARDSYESKQGSGNPSSQINYRNEYDLGRGESNASMFSNQTLQSAQSPNWATKKREELMMKLGESQSSC